MDNLSILNKQNDPILAKAISCGLREEYSLLLQYATNDASTDALFLRGLGLLHLGKKSDALQCFERLAGQPQSNFLVPAFCDLLSGNDTEAAKMYGGVEFIRYFQAAAQSKIFEAVHITIDNTLKSFPPAGDTYTIIELGIGTAKQMVRILSWIPDTWPWVKSVRIIGVEPYDHLAQIADKTLRNAATTSHLTVEYCLLNSFAQDLTSDFLGTMLQGQRPEVVNACMSIHHMDRENKLGLLQVIRSLNPALFVVADVDSDHESNLAPLSLPLIANVMSLYENTLSLLMEEQPDEETAKLYRGFCFYDACNILVEAGDKRIEFHTTAENWKHYLKTRGFKLLTPRIDWLAGIPQNFCHCAAEHLCTTYYGRPLTFQIVAQCAS